MTHRPTHAKNQGQRSHGSKATVDMDGRTLPIAVPCPLTQSVIRFTRRLVDSECRAVPRRQPSLLAVVIMQNELTYCTHRYIRHNRYTDAIVNETSAARFFSNHLIRSDRSFRDKIQYEIQKKHLIGCRNGRRRRCEERRWARDARGAVHSAVYSRNSAECRHSVTPAGEYLMRRSHHNHELN